MSFVPFLWCSETPLHQHLRTLLSGPEKRCLFIFHVNAGNVQNTLFVRPCLWRDRVLFVFWASMACRPALGVVCNLPRNGEGWKLFPLAHPTFFLSCKLGQWLVLATPSRRPRSFLLHHPLWMSYPVPADNLPLVKGGLLGFKVPSHGLLRW